MQPPKRKSRSKHYKYDEKGSYTLTKSDVRGLKAALEEAVAEDEDSDQDPELPQDSSEQESDTDADPDSDDGLVAFELRDEDEVAAGSGQESQEAAGSDGEASSQDTGAGKGRKRAAGKPSAFRRWVYTSSCLIQHVCLDVGVSSSSWFAQVSSRGFSSLSLPVLFGSSLQVVDLLKLSGSV
jgi:hypothetical protein